MKIKGFDKDLKCRGGFQFEVGKIYDTGAADNEIEICSNTVFHYCESLHDVHLHYDCHPSSGNRFCEIEVLGAEVKNDEKCGSNRIKIVREIAGEELDVLRGKINGNTGVFNSGSYNSGWYNSGSRNSGSCNSGSRNSGSHNSGSCNSGSYNSGSYNSGLYNPGLYNSGSYNSGWYNSGWYNSGSRNSGSRNSGSCNSGLYNPGLYNSGSYNSGWYNSGSHNSGSCNSGSYNSGSYNSGSCNSGRWNSCNYSNGVFCSEEDKNIRIFNKPSGMSLMEWMTSKYNNALNSAPFILTEWVEYIQEEQDAPDKKATGGYLKTYTYKEACAKWWAAMSEENKEIVKSIPNFDPAVFEEITGIKV